MKKNAYLHEFNILMDRKVYLPNVSGMLRAYAEAQPRIGGAYQFMPFLFVRQEPEKIARTWDNPSVLAFSSSMWNHQLNLTLARRARELFPEALIVFGGPHVPTRAEKLLEDYPFVDVAVRSEGEVTFADLLARFLEGKDFSGVDGIVYRDPVTNECVRTKDRSLVDINELPSPYLAGLYDEFLDRRGNVEYQVILETNRGCPFHCSFCAWGNSITKVRLFDIERIKREIDWVGEKQISYVFGADANFGMFPQDKRIAELFVEKKHQDGYPKVFRVCYGKNATDRIFEVAKLLEASKMTAGVTVSFQSTDPRTLILIGRSNIKIDTYRELLKRYRREGISVYTELVLGLPGETYESFARGIEEVFQAGLYDQVGIFLCEVLPNTEMDHPDYAELHGIETKRIELAETHAVRRQPGEVREYEDIVVSTRAMPREDWKRSVTLAWMAQTLHGLKLGFFIALYLFKRFGVRYTELFEHLIAEGADRDRFPVFAREYMFFAEYLEGLLSGKPQCVFLDEFGRISWQIEEATFLRLSGDLAEFCREFQVLVEKLLRERGIDFEPEEVREVVSYQLARSACMDPSRPREWRFSRNLPEYFDRLMRDLPTDIQKKPQTLAVAATDYGGKKGEFARQVIWYGRRDCRTLESATWY